MKAIFTTETGRKDQYAEIKNRIILYSLSK